MGRSARWVLANRLRRRGDAVDLDPGQSGGNLEAGLPPTPIYSKKIAGALLTPPCARGFRPDLNESTAKEQPQTKRKSIRIANKPKIDLTMEQQATVLLMKKCGLVDDGDPMVKDKIAKFPEQFAGKLKEDAVGGYRDLFGLDNVGSADALSALAIHADA